ncbi:MAG TPA: peptidase M64 N-terminal domain-containing protein, partial [bacterium]|nr:peptidase M64 N-terminal domain-containing protein [bacterium]
MLFILGVLAVMGTNDFDAYFTGQTMRFDYYHSGTAKEEHISPDEYRIEGVWPGSKTVLLDETGLGKYLFEVSDVASGKLLYTRGFASIYGEWETTGEAAKGVWRSFHESQRFPEPKNAVKLTLKKRGADNRFASFYETTIDPKSRFVNRAPAVKNGEV